MMCEQTGPNQLVRDVALAEEAGFDFAVISYPTAGSLSAWAQAKSQRAHCRRAMAACPVAP
jgi:hypothetical protein